MGKQRVFMTFVMFLAICGFIFTVSCTKPHKVRSTNEDLQSVESTFPQEEAVVMEVEQIEEEEEIIEEEAIIEEKAMAREVFKSENIHFDFDKSSITPAAREVLRRKATFLLNNTDVSILVEGHCDERGTSEYNLALGDRRAKAAMDFLVDMGVEPSRVSTISLGEEQPLDSRQTPSAWAKNRRAHFSEKM